MSHWLVTEVDSVSTLPQWSVAATRRKSFKVIHGQVENLRRHCFYFAMMICCYRWISVLQRLLGTGGQPKEKMFLLCDDDPLLQTDVRPSNKLMDKSRTEGETVYTLRWWSVAANRCESFKQIYGQVENRRKNCLYFEMMIRCCKQNWVLQGHWVRGRELKEQLFQHCGDEMLVLINVSPLSKCNHWFIMKRGTVLSFLFFIKYINSP